MVEFFDSLLYIAFLFWFTVGHITFLMDKHQQTTNVLLIALCLGVILSW